METEVRAELLQSAANDVHNALAVNKLNISEAVYVLEAVKASFLNDVMAHPVDGEPDGADDTAATESDQVA